MSSIPLSDDSLPRVCLIGELLDRIYRRQWPFAKVYGLWTSPDVPYGHYHPQWDTKGRLWIWVSREAVDDVPQREPGSWVHEIMILPPSLTGIPIYHR